MRYSVTVNLFQIVNLRQILKVVRYRRHACKSEASKLDYVLSCVTQFRHLKSSVADCELLQIGLAHLEVCRGEVYVTVAEDEIVGLMHQVAEACISWLVGLVQSDQLNLLEYKVTLLFGQTFAESKQIDVMALFAINL